MEVWCSYAQDELNEQITWSYFNLSIYMKTSNWDLKKNENMQIDIYKISLMSNLSKCMKTSNWDLKKSHKWKQAIKQFF